MATTPKIENGYADGSTNSVRSETFTYPNGRVITYAYGDAGGINDQASRIQSIVDDDAGSTHLVDYEYLGLGAVVKQHSPQPDLLMTLVSLDGSDDPDTGDIYAGVDRFGRVKDLRWRNVGADTDLSRVQYGYNRASNRIWRGNPTDPDRHYDWLYTYDGLQRLIDAQRGTLVDGNTAIDDLQFRQCWTLDPTGNWRGFRQDDDGASSWDLIQTRSADEANQISGITNTVGDAWAQPEYDLAGNMDAVPKPADLTEAFAAVYDAWNRLTALAGVASYEYDARSYRVTSNDGSTRHFYYTNAWQAIEERLATSTSANRQFVWGLRYIDDLILRDRTTSATLDERASALQDGNWNVTAITDSSGGVQERLEYDSYSNTTFLDPDFNARPGSSFEWETTYCGYTHNDNTGLLHTRLRDLHTSVGWIESDPLAYVTSTNLFEYARSSPITSVDPLGLADRPTPISPFDFSTVEALAESLYPGMGRNRNPTGVTLEEYTAYLYDSLNRQFYDDYERQREQQAAWVAAELRSQLWYQQQLQAQSDAQAGTLNRWIPPSSDAGVFEQEYIWTAYERGGSLAAWNAGMGRHLLNVDSAGAGASIPGIIPRCPTRPIVVPSYVGYQPWSWPQPRVPDWPPPLPRSRSGAPLPSSFYSHSQIGTRTSTTSPPYDYIQGRTFGFSGREIYRIDFTSHPGHSGYHPYPHYHPIDPATGAIGGPRPLSLFWLHR